jgi:UDP-N-acetylmuramoylalanine--D-glutamate ligase
VTYVDDALASNPFATAASVDAFAHRDLTVIVGGADRGVDPTGLVQALSDRRPAPRVIVLPPDPERLAGPLEQAAAGPGARSGMAVEVATGLDDAVRRARAATPPGGVVLFSPAAPTPGGQGGYAARGRQFAEAAGLARGPSVLTRVPGPTTVRNDQGGRG